MMKEKIIKALEFNRIAYNAVKDNFERGMSEQDVKQIILSACSGADDFSGDIVGGLRSSLVEGDATNYILKEGDCLILDIQFKHCDVWTDTTRTFFIGPPSNEVRNAYNLCIAAKKAGESIMRNGVVSCEIYNAICLAFNSYRNNFPHHAGHAFGKEKLIQPQFLPERKECLCTNDFVTIEPGLYFDEKFGVRIEDNYQIVENGFINLFDYPLQIENYII